uniref:Uncharacterized protein n=1 Tax=Populus trichocarpa TaxID=3694 RepID=A0A2K1XGI6_POPTR
MHASCGNSQVQLSSIDSISHPLLAFFSVYVASPLPHPHFSLPQIAFFNSSPSFCKPDQWKRE